MTSLTQHEIQDVKVTQVQQGRTKPTLLTDYLEHFFGGKTKI